jgi:hypothetical protein
MAPVMSGAWGITISRRWASERARVAWYGNSADMKSTSCCGWFPLLVVWEVVLGAATARWVLAIIAASDGCA